MFYKHMSWFFDEVVINSSLAKSWHDLCMEESTCLEMIIDP